MKVHSIWYPCQQNIQGWFTDYFCEGTLLQMNTLLNQIILRFNLFSFAIVFSLSKYTFGNIVFPHIVSAETILFWIWSYVLWPYINVRKLFKGGNYSRAETIWGKTVHYNRLDEKPTQPGTFHTLIGKFAHRISTNSFRVITGGHSQCTFVKNFNPLYSLNLLYINHSW